MAATHPADLGATDGETTRSSSFLAHYGRIALRPRAGFHALLGDPRRLRWGALALLSTALLYTLVYVFLVLGRGRPTVFHPFLAIDPEQYYQWNVWFVAPSMVMCWLVASSVAQLLARGLGGRGSFEDTAAVVGMGTSIASWWTLGHDLVTTFLGATGVIDQRAYEDAMSSPTVFRTMLWGLMAAYLVAFVALYACGVRMAHQLSRARALVVGAVGFAVYQGVFVIFNR